MRISPREYAAAPCTVMNIGDESSGAAMSDVLDSCIHWMRPKSPQHFAWRWQAQGHGAQVGSRCRGMGSPRCEAALGVREANEGERARGTGQLLHNFLTTIYLLIIFVCRRFCVAPRTKVRNMPALCETRETHVYHFSWRCLLELLPFRLANLKPGQLLYI